MREERGAERFRLPLTLATTTTTSQGLVPRRFADGRSSATYLEFFVVRHLSLLYVERRW